MSFSQRKGYKTVSNTIQTNWMADNLRNSIWNALDLLVWTEEDFRRREYHTVGDKYFTNYWVSYLKQPLDSRPTLMVNALRDIRNYYFGCEWYEVYDFLE